jgi:hypothetical protein
MELDPSPVGGIISTKKTAKEKTDAPKKPPKDKSVLQAVKRKALGADPEPSSSKDTEVTKTKRTKIALTRKVSNSTKKADGNTQEVSWMLLPSLAFAKA